MHIIDFHTHAFPDKLAERAVPALAKEANITAALDGKTSSLLQSMNRAGIEKSVICSIATRPEQFSKILEWSHAVASDRLIPFPSIHPDDPAAAAQVRRIHEEGFLGVKLHPYYQNFYLNEPRMNPVYEALQACGLILVTHTGFDIAFPRDRRCDAQQILHVIENFPELKFVATHFGAWEDWDRVENQLIGRRLYMDISFSTSYLEPGRLRRMMAAHSPDHLLFGSDSPWTGQQEEIDRVLALGLENPFLSKLLYENAARLLGLSGTDSLPSK
ncbi:MAG TPA: amidohydrolase [Verrucomicrobia bacterium]|nr:MAG: amidohydrolase [Lentisphaerae bacterium GWF2_57_35]HBA86221.1 amidohydrolase [Verrucomicrobiota bacterium]